MWVLVTMAAAAFQTARTAQQHRLRALLSVSGAGFVRYAYGAPLAMTAVAVAAAVDGLPSTPARFWPIIVAAGLAQIVATACLISAFDASDYATGTVYSKTEVVQVAVFSAVLLGEPLRPFGWAGAAVVMAGIVLLVSKGDPRRFVRARSSLSTRALGLGVVAGGLFALAAVGIRAASRSLDSGGPVVRSLVALAVMNTSQTVLHGGLLALKNPAELRACARHWRSSSVVGVLSVCGSGAWALAMTLENVARVRTVGQVELLFTFAVSRFALRETRTRAEWSAALLVGVGVVTVMIAG